MSVVNNDPVDQDQNASGADISQNVEAKQDVVKYESYKKALMETKSAKEKARKLEAELESKRQAELEAQGNYQVIIEELRGKLEETNTALLTTKKQALWKDVTGAIKTEAANQGCINPDKLIRLFDKNDFETLQSEDGEIRRESVSQLIEKAKKEDYYLFTKGEVKVMDATPISRMGEAATDYSKLSTEELIEKMKS